MDEKAPHVIGERKPYDRYAEIVRKLKRVAGVVFVDKIFDADFDVKHGTSILLPLILPFRIPKDELKSIAQFLLVFFAEIVGVTVEHDL